MGKYKIFVDGSSGTTGLRIADRLAERDEFEILKISAADRKDVRARAAVINESDLSFLCLPDDAAREGMPRVREDVRILDTSTAHRTAPGWVYGLPELHGTRAALPAAARVAVPGCYASGFISIMRPLVELGLAGVGDFYSCTGISGYSGGGKKMIAEYRAPERSPLLNAPRQYALGQTHKHLKEMKAVTGLASEPVFCPVVADFYSGMKVTVPLFAGWLKPCAGMEEVKIAYTALYTGPVVSYTDAADEGGFLSAAAQSGLDSMKLTVAGNEQRMLLLAVYDNLGKGASGAAGECMNLVTGAEKTLGLEL